MFTRSIWNTFSAETNFPALDGDFSADVAIMGGGITGITTALLLSKKGLKVIVLEARKVGGGTTAHSTGNLYVVIDQKLSSIQSKYDTETLRNIITARSGAIDLIERNVNEFSLDCDFKRQPWLLYAADDESNSIIKDEYDAALDAGILVEKGADTDIPFPVKNAIRLSGQAQFNPMRYVQELANSISGDNCRIFENTRVTDISEEEDKVILKTTKGVVTARYALHATHIPKGLKVEYHTVLGPYREYGVAATLADDNYPEGIFWGYHNGSEKFSLRSYVRGEQKFIMAIGQPHKVGQAEDNQQHIRNLEEFLRARFNIKEITHRWGGQHYRPADMLPYIGRIDTGSNVFVASGFSTDGLVYGTLSGMIISEIISGREYPHANLFEASRHQPAKAAGKFMKENLNVANQFLKDYIFNSNDTELADIAPGEGRILEKDGNKIAASRGDDGMIRLNSAICTHMACVVHWNNAEKTWDCPCHGSRFSTEGNVLEGPAFHPLGKIVLSGDELEDQKRE